MKMIDKIKSKIFDVINPEVEYNLEDFDKEFANVNTVDESYKMDIKFVNKSNNLNPKYETSGSSGFDLRANLEKPFILKNGEFAVIPTGLYFETPDNFEIQIRPRSGLAAKYGVTVLNTPGTIDADYRGEIKVILINHGQQPFEINNGDRIAQGVIASVVNENIFTFTEVHEVSDNTERSSGGFGSTGLR